MRKILLLPFLICVSAHSASVRGKPAAPAKPAAAAPADAPGSAGGLDTARARKLYQDGDFEQAIAILESALKEKRVVDHSDSVFVFKHLGVMYAASENTRERGKYFMMQLLTIEPTARIMDMYASDMIYMIFKNIQEEYAASHAKYAHAQNLAPGGRADDAKPPEASRPASEPARKESHAAYYWAGSILAVVGIGVAIFVLTDEKKPPTTTHQID